MQVYDMVAVGKLCRRARRRRDYTQKHIAQETGYSVESICGFEHGRSCNAKLLLWYLLECGLTIDELKGCLLYGKAI